MKITLKSGTHIDEAVTQIKEILDEVSLENKLTQDATLYIGKESLTSILDTEQITNIQRAYAKARSEFRDEMLSYFECILNIDLDDDLRTCKKAYKEAVKNNNKDCEIVEELCTRRKISLRQKDEFKYTLPLYKKLYSMCMSASEKSTIYLNVVGITDDEIFIKVYQEFIVDETKYYYANKHVSHILREHFGNIYHYKF